MKKTKMLNYCFGDKHKQYMRRCLDNTINVAEGAVRAGKTVDNVFAFSQELETAPDKIHLATGSTIANAKLNIGDCNGLGLEGIFRGRCRWGKYKDNECLRIKTPTGLKIVIFAGGGKADSFKKIRGNSYGMWIATEINLHHDNTIKEAFNRQLAAQHRKIYWDLNPDNPNAKIYTDYIDSYAKLQISGTFRGGYNYEHFTIRDNVTITAERMEEIISQYKTESLWYKRDILGQRCVADGLIYDMFNVARHVVPTDSCRKYIEYVLSCDYGTQNPMSIGLWGYSAGVWYRVKEYYYSGREKQKQKTDEEYYRDLVSFVGDIPVKLIIIDPSAASFIACLRRHGKFIPQAANNAVIDGIRFTGSLFSADIIKIQDCCINWISEVQGYHWDETAKEDKPVKEADHAMDDTRYFCATHISRNAYKYGVHKIGAIRGENSGNN